MSLDTGGSPFYLHYDGLGSIVNLTSSSGATQWTYDYLPYGGVRTAAISIEGAATASYAGPLGVGADLLFKTATGQKVDATDAVGALTSIIPVPEGFLSQIIAGVSIDLLNRGIGSALGRQAK